MPTSLAMAFRHVQMNETLSSPPGGNGVRASSEPSNSNFSILAIGIIGIVCTAFLLVSYYVFVIKCCLNWRHFSHRFRRFRSFQHFSDPQNRQQQQPPAIYTAERNGLEENVIRSIPVFLFKEKDCFLSGGSYECAVCLNQFEEGVRLRLLPKCTHAFHIDCIDTWLQAHSNCPLCRSSVSNTVVTREYSIEIDNQVAETCPSFSANGFQRENATASRSVEIGVGAEEGRQSMAASSRGSSSSKISPKKLVGTGFLEVKLVGRKSLADEKKVHHKHLSSVGDECIHTRERDDLFSVEPIRRSFSMDSSGERQLYISVADILAENPHLREVSTDEGSSSKTKRTFFPLFNHGRGIPKNAVLPVRLEPM